MRARVTGSEKDVKSSIDKVVFALSGNFASMSLLKVITEQKANIDLGRPFNLVRFLDEVAKCINNLNGTFSDTRKHEAQLHHDLTRPVRPTRWTDDDCDDDI